MRSTFFLIGCLFIFIRSVVIGNDTFDEQYESPSEMIQLYCQSTCVKDTMNLVSGLNDMDIVDQGESLFKFGSSNTIAGTSFSLEEGDVNEEHVVIHELGTYLATFSVGVSCSPLEITQVDLQLNGESLTGGQSLLVSNESIITSLEATLTFDAKSGDIVSLVNSSPNKIQVAKRSAATSEPVRLYLQRLK